jgi:hypothetical protein
MEFNLDYFEKLHEGKEFFDSVYVRKSKTDDTVRGATFEGKWEQKNWLNVPGPFYGAETDTCGNGPVEAPDNVLMDLEGQEFVYRQPRNWDELRNMMAVALTEPIEGYGVDGNLHWTSDLVRKWWRRREEIIEYSSKVKQDWLTHEPWYHSNDSGWIADAHNQAIQGWQSYLSSSILPHYLRTYIYYLEERRLPGSTDILPGL